MQLSVTQTLMLSFSTLTPLYSRPMFTMLHCCNLEIPRLHSPHLAELVDDTLLDVQEVMPLRGLPHNNTSNCCVLCCDVVWQVVLCCRVSWCGVLSCVVVWCVVVVGGVMYCIGLWCVELRWVGLGCVLLCVVMCCVMVCCEVVSRGVLCCCGLCCDVVL